VAGGVDRSYAYKDLHHRLTPVDLTAESTVGHPGRLRLDYYEDEDNFRCSVYSQTIWVNGRPEEARGRACQQPDGAWAIID
jgi:hypothetical protein